MEDLKELQYQMAQRREGLDFEHCRIALRKLGQMHAASMALVNENLSLMDKFNFGMFHGSVSNPGQIQLCLPLSFPLLCERVKMWKGFEGIYRKLNRMKENFWPMMYESTSRKHDGYRVLTHVDFWTKNFLYKYNETSGKPIDVLFVDLQHSCYTSPANDLQYFLSISPQNHVREQHREELVRIYYESFAATLYELNYSKIPTFAQLQDEMRKKEMLGFFAAVFVLPIALMEEQSTQGSGLDGLMDEEARKEMTWLMISGKSYTEAIKPILKRCDNLGVFDLQPYQGDSNY
uniref:CHK kinase-like domain-containing protein n=2 Tax=Lutzomyia longipalpis TaxID=7200 RepID=A0A1B0GL90_LUTLO